MKFKKLEELMHWIYEELETIDHGELQVVFKVRDHKVVLIERVKIEKEKPED